MRAVLLSAACAASLAGLAPAHATITTLGSTYAESCFRAAEARDIRQPALESCNRALNVEGLDGYRRVATHVNRGILLMTAGDLASAHRDFDRALSLDPNEPEAWLNKGIAEMKAGNEAVAMQLVDKALQLRTRKPAVAHYVRAIAHEDAGNLSAAYADLQRAQSLDPKWREPAVELARYRVTRR